MANWQSDPSGSVPYAGVNQDDIVNFNDYAILCQNWMGKSTSVFIGNISVASFDPVLCPKPTTIGALMSETAAMQQEGSLELYNTL